MRADHFRTGEASTNPLFSITRPDKKQLPKPQNKGWSGQEYLRPRCVHPYKSTVPFIRPGTHIRIILKSTLKNTSHTGWNQPGKSSSPSTGVILQQRNFLPVQKPS